MYEYVIDEHHDNRRKDSPDRKPQQSEETVYQVDRDRADFWDHIDQKDKSHDRSNY